jgi:hypothetical protein
MGRAPVEDAQRAEALGDADPQNLLPQLKNPFLWLLHTAPSPARQFSPSGLIQPETIFP